MEDCYEIQECMICYDLIDEINMNKLVCGHEFHDKCICKWLKNDMSCPLCRYKIENTNDTTTANDLTTNNINYGFYLALINQIPYERVYYYPNYYPILPNNRNLTKEEIDKLNKKNVNKARKLQNRNDSKLAFKKEKNYNKCKSKR